ncbi:hypothetical protein C8R44DRAFT_729031 [Mycena epipterygia]|nr:hypothetical protein C8R44DRAFT_729031 [Mycena epipterygia]
MSQNRFLSLFRASEIWVFILRASPSLVPQVFSSEGRVTRHLNTVVIVQYFSGFAYNLAFYPLNGWRHQHGAAFVPAIDLSFLIWLVPESPWLLKKQRYRESFAAFAACCYAHAQPVAEEKAFARITYRRRIVELLMVPRLQRATLAIFIDMATTQKFRGIGISGGRKPFRKRPTILPNFRSPYIASGAPATEDYTPASVHVSGGGALRVRTLKEWSARQGRIFRGGKEEKQANGVFWDLKSRRFRRRVNVEGVEDFTLETTDILHVLSNGRAERSLETAAGIIRCRSSAQSSEPKFAERTPSASNRLAYRKCCAGEEIFILHREQSGAGGVEHSPHEGLRNAWTARDEHESFPGKNTDPGGNEAEQGVIGVGRPGKLGKDQRLADERAGAEVRRTCGHDGGLGVKLNELVGVRKRHGYAAASK